jgi:hypothetical protein
MPDKKLSLSKREADEHSLSHEELAQAGLLDAADAEDSAGASRYPDGFTFDLGDGVTVRAEQLREEK